MPTRFDHAVIAVRDLPSALQLFQHLGFEALPGGRHTGRGTYNGLVRFGLDYLELLSVYDETEARTYNHGRRIILDELNGHKAALVSYALATNHIEQDAQLFQASYPDLPLPDVMTRKRPDGHTLRWRTLTPGENSWHKPWPFLIQWDMPDSQRLQIDQPGTHPNGAINWSRIAIVTHDLNRTLAIYQDQLGLQPIPSPDPALENTHHALLKIGNSFIDLLTPTGESPLQPILTENGEGPFLLTFAVKNLETTHTYFTKNSLKYSQTAQSLDLDPSEALGIRLRFIQYL